MRSTEPVSYLELARAVLGSPPATKATEATKDVLEEVWRAGGWLVISNHGVRAVRVPPELSAWVTERTGSVLQTLHRQERSQRSQPA